MVEQHRCGEFAHRMTLAVDKATANLKRLLENLIERTS
jgi:hypothetical protein